ncbi:MAG TPA: hypothetical protein DD414_10035 [Lachnospiraceae bacterium]|nr:hypothetical protein [Lachnospiraceae bacterium]
MIHKVINNNIIVILDAHGNERILMGRGIGFKRHPGDEFDKNLVEKEFTLSLYGQNDRLTDLLNEIPMEVIRAAASIVEQAEEELGKKINESIVISLSDHIHTAIERSREGIYVKNILLWETRKFYPAEFRIGKHALSIIKKETGTTLFEDEAGFIALHIVNAQMEKSVGDMYGLTKVMQEILNIIKYTCRIAFDEDSFYFCRFITHLKFFAQRLLTHTTYDSNDNGELLTVVKKQYKRAFDCVGKIGIFLQNNYDYALSEEEQLYLTIHIARIIDKSSR